MTKRSGIGVIVALALAGSVLWAARPIAGESAVQPVPTVSDHHALLWSAFPEQPLESITNTQRQVTAEGGMTHIVVHYRSKRPVPVTLTPAYKEGNRLGMDFSQRIAAVLPAADTATVALPLVRSPGWRMTTRHAVVELFATPESGLSIITIDTQLHRIAGLRQVLTSEPWRLTSVNFLAGYRMFGLSLSVLLAMAMLAVMFHQRKNGWIEAAGIAASIVVVALHGRFAADFASATMTDIHAWRTEQTLPELGSIIAMAGDSTHSGSLAIATCGYGGAPVRYVIFPQPLSTLDAAGIVIVPTAWTRNDGSVVCGDTAFAGSIVKRYPNGGALVRKQPSQPNP